MPTWIDRLREEHSLPPEGYRYLLTTSRAHEELQLLAAAREVALSTFSNKVFLRGLIEVSNYCRNNCFYCGIRGENRSVNRYRLGKEEILSCCEEGYAIGLRTFVLQGGEDPKQNIHWLLDVISTVRRTYPDCAITLSLGEKSKEEYQALYQAGANRYLLRHETANEQHYNVLHPQNLSGSYRKQCLRWLKEIGFQTGTGIMVGSPGQTVDHIVEDLLFIEELRPEMIGLGPFIAHHATPFANKPNGSIARTLRLLAICRLMNPKALIPSTTALATLGNTNGRLQGILAGANVIMPNLSPFGARAKYELYDNKAYTQGESAQGIIQLQQELNTIGYEISLDRGDYDPQRYYSRPVGTNE